MIAAATLLRFGLVGGAAFIIDGGILILIAPLGFGFYAGRIVSLTVSVIFTFFMNRRFTFRSAHPPSWAEFGRYVRTVLFGSALNYALYSGGLLLNMHPILALALATIVTAIFNFVQFKIIFTGRRTVRSVEDRSAR